MHNRSNEPSLANAMATPSSACGEQVLARARALKQAAGAGAPPMLLKGKYFGLVSERPDTPDAALFVAAATGLGAQVAQIRPSVARLGAADDVEQAAMLMGRLYDAVECQGLLPETVQRMRAAAGVPVFDGLACATQPSADWRAWHETLAGNDDDRRFLLQATLLELID